MRLSGEGGRHRCTDSLETKGIVVIPNDNKMVVGDGAPFYRKHMKHIADLLLNQPGLQVLACACLVELRAVKYLDE